MERADAPRGGTQEGVRVGAEGGEGAGKTREQNTGPRPAPEKKKKRKIGERETKRGPEYNPLPRDCFGEFSESQSRLLCSGNNRVCFPLLFSLLWEPQVVSL